MSDTVVVAIIGGVVTILLALVTLISLRIQLKNNIIIAQIAARQAINSNDINDKVDKYHKEVNGKMGELLDTTKALGNAEGRAEQKAGK